MDAEAADVAAPADTGGDAARSAKRLRRISLARDDRVGRAGDGSGASILDNPALRRNAGEEIAFFCFGTFSSGVLGFVEGFIAFAVVVVVPDEDPTADANMLLPLCLLLVSNSRILRCTGLSSGIASWVWENPALFCSNKANRTLWCFRCWTEEALAGSTAHI